MNTKDLFADFSAVELAGRGNLRFHTFIEGAHPEAKRILENGSFIRERYCDGNHNSSLTATPEGAIAIARFLAKHTDITPVRDSERLFGENIRETWAALKLLWRK